MARNGTGNSIPTIDIEHPTIDLIEPGRGEQDLHKMAEDELFMNEPVEIYVHPVSDENAPPYVILNCNGTNQPVARGVNQVVKRKFVEILARMKETKYSQQPANPYEPDNRPLVGRQGMCYPFDMVSDRNPKGRAWLNKIMAEAA